jgi:hypothetical protein
MDSIPSITSGAGIQIWGLKAIPKLGEKIAINGEGCQTAGAFAVLSSFLGNVFQLFWSNCNTFERIELIITIDVRPVCGRLATASNGPLGRRGPGRAHARHNEQWAANEL